MPRRPQKHIIGALAIAASMVAATVPAGATATPPTTAVAAAYKRCPNVVIDRRLSASAVVSQAKGMSCGSARAVVRRYGKNYDSSDAFDRGGRFTLGSYRCTVLAQLGEELWRAGCSLGSRAFRVEYGA